MNRVLFLYTELAEYFMACARKLHEKADVEVHIVRWPVQAEAPFRFEIPEGMGVYERERYSGASLKALVDEIDPDMILCSGWIDKDYLRTVRDYVKKVPTVLILDNQWSASFRQRVGRLWASWRIYPLFSHVWVPGEPQAAYARRIGFSEDRILKGFYTADLERFSRIEEERGELPRRFVYLGRYVEHKGVRDLWKAFMELVEEGRGGDWELFCCGTGELYPERPEHPRIFHLGFLQPDDIPDVMRRTSVYILPSHFEPWGVVVQEFAASGAPLLLSDAVGAASAFLEEGENGLSFPKGDREALKERMAQFVNKSGEALKKMGDRSHELALHPSQEDWVDNVLSILKKKEL